MVAKYRNNLPQISQGNKLFITDGGIETTLIFLHHLNLPLFAAFDLLKTEKGCTALQSYFESYASIARKLKTGVILESATWRASNDWGSRLGYTNETLDDANMKSISLLEGLRVIHEREWKRDGDNGSSESGDSEVSPLVISGCVGPRGDGYVPGSVMNVEEATNYHLQQITTFANTNADMICAITMNYVEEAIGVVMASKRVGMPVAISFTVETNGCLPTGQSLQSAIEQVDLATSSYPLYYMINCAHPSHFSHILAGDGEWIRRIRGIRANASTKSHAELNEATELDRGDPSELAEKYVMIKKSHLPNLNVMGGCCGTDHQHVELIGKSCAPLFALPSP